MSEAFIKYQGPTLDTQSVKDGKNIILCESDQLCCILVDANNPNEAIIASQFARLRSQGSLPCSFLCKARSIVMIAAITIDFTAHGGGRSAQPNRNGAHS